MSDFDFSHLKPDEKAILNWHLKRREAQTCPVVVRGRSKVPYIWLLRGGRGSGKTLTAANHLFEYARHLALTLPRTLENDIIRIAVVGQNFSDVRGTMIEGQSGLLSVIPKELVKKWNRTYCELRVSIPSAEGTSGSRELLFLGFTSQVPEKLRGPQFHAAWIDEPGKFEDADAEPMARDTTWSNLMMCTRLGKEANAPHIVVTGTPTPCKLIKFLEDHPDSSVTYMSTWDNIDNLPEAYAHELSSMNKNSRTYQQEIMAQILDDNPEAIFSEDTINHGRYGEGNNFELPPLDQLLKVVSWDPSVGTSEEGDEAGIILVGYTPELKEKAKGINGSGKPKILEKAHAYILKDLSGHISPYDQAALVLDTILEEKAGDVVWETNQGSDILITMLEQVMKERSDGNYTIRKEKAKRREDYGTIKRYKIKITMSPLLEEPFTHEFTASAVHVVKNKKTRAETAAVKYDQGQVHHPPANTLPICEKDMCRASLEVQMTRWNPNSATHRRNSPDRMDALVYALFLIFGPGGKRAGPNSWLSAPTGSTVSKYGGGQSQIIQEEQARVKAAVTIYSTDLMTGRQVGMQNRQTADEEIWARRIY